MNSILSIVMVIVMAFSSIGGVTAALKEPVSFDAKINVDADGILNGEGEIFIFKLNFFLGFL